MRIKFGSQKGAAMVEFALVLPLLLLIVFGIIEFGIIFFNQQVITNASREGARYGIVSQTPRVTQTQIRQRVKDYCFNNLITFGSTNRTPGDADITMVGWTSAPVFPTNDLRVTVSWNYQFLVLPAIGSTFFGGSADTGIPLSATSLMKYE
jgi:Flp pilus assembly protein TadG